MRRRTRGVIAALFIFLFFSFIIGTIYSPPAYAPIKVNKYTIPAGGDLLADGSVPLTADWDLGSYNITVTGVVLDWVELGGSNRTTWPNPGSGEGSPRYDWDYLIFNNITGYHLVNEVGGIDLTTASLETAVETAWSNLASGGIITLHGPGETWTVDDEINSQSDYVSIKSDWSLILVATANLDKEIFDVTHDYINFEGLYLDGNGPNQGAGTYYGIHLNGVHDIGIYRCYFTDVDYAPIRIAGGSYGIDIAYSTFSENRKRGCISSSGANYNIRVRGNYIVDNSQDGATHDPDIEVYSGGYLWTITNNIFNRSWYSSVYLAGTAGNNVHDITVSNNVINDNQDGGGMRVQYGRRITFSNNEIYSVTHYGYLLNNVEDITVEGGTVVDSHQWGLSVSVDDGFVARNIVVTGVTFHNCSNEDWRGGIILIGTGGAIEKVTISNNIFYDTQANDHMASGISFQDGVNDVTISNNDFDGMSTFGIDLNAASGSDRTIIMGNRFKNMNTAIEADDGDKVMVIGNYFDTTVGIDMGNAACTNWMVSLNDFEDSTTDITAGGAVGTHWGDNVDQNGNWDHDAEP